MINKPTAEEKRLRRKRRTENKRRHHLLRMEFDADAIRKRARREKEKAQERIASRAARIRGMLPPAKHETFLSKIKNKLISD